jgi:DNA-3-methyladenine glycosylase I
LLLLESAQAGLAWITVLRKREGYRHAFDQFDPALVAAYDPSRIEMLVNNKNIIRHRMKIESAVSNAQAFLRVQAEHSTFDAYIWQFIGGHPKQNRWHSPQTVPSQTPESQAMSKDLQARGFRFTGPTICYAFMQAIGMVNDHLVDCDRYEQLARP